MKFSAKSRYALASLLVMTTDAAKHTRFTVAYLAGALHISKEYLEQIFSLLRRGRLITSVKGPQGGYCLARPSEEITVFDILTAMEPAMFEPTVTTVPDRAPHIESALTSMVYTQLDETVHSALSSITLADLRDKVYQHSAEGYMYYL